jgi:hypothetical protein
MRHLGNTRPRNAWGLFAFERVTKSSGGCLRSLHTPMSAGAGGISIELNSAFAKFSVVSLGRARLHHARFGAKEVAERHQGLDAVANQLQRGEHRHSEDSAGNAPHPIPED